MRIRLRNTGLRHTRQGTGIDKKGPAYGEILHYMKTLSTTLMTAIATTSVNISTGFQAYARVGIC
jgi:hypothetical protein